MKAFASSTAALCLMTPVGLLKGRSGEVRNKAKAKPYLPQADNPSEKKAIYKVGKIGYDGENRTHSQSSFEGEAAGSLNESVTGSCTASVSQAAPTDVIQYTSEKIASQTDQA